MLYIHSIFSVMCYVIFSMIFAGIFVQERGRHKINKFLMIIGMMLVLSLWISCLYNQFIIKIVGQIVFYSLFLWWLCDIKYLKSLALTCIFFCGCTGADYLVMLVIMKAMPIGSMTLLESSFGSSLVEVFSECVHLLIIIIIMRCFKKKDSELLTTKEWLRFAIIPVISLVTIATLMIEFDLAQKENQESVFLMIAIGLVIMNIIVYFLLNDILKREAALREERIFKERANNEIKMYHSLAENYEKQRKIQHEYKNRIDSITALVKEEKYAELNRYLSNLNQEITEVITVINVNNVMINAILNTKYHEMRKKGILLIMQMNDLSQIPVSDEDIVVILANLLNNAMEACKDCEEKIIKLKFIHDERGMVLSVMNTYSVPPIVSGNKFQTTKLKDREMHGIGISNVKEMVEKYGGETVIKVTDEEFRFIIALPQVRTA